MRKRLFRCFRYVVLTCMVVACGIAFCGCGNTKSKTESTVRIGSLKGPTSMGLLFLMDENANQKSQNKYEFEMATAADEILAKMLQNELDIALVPANVAAILYQKSEGQICAIDINTMGVLYFVTGDMQIQSPKDLEGKTIYLTGKGTTPDYVLQILLEEYDVSDCQLEYKSEATEVAAVLGKNPEAIGFLPQPFATAVRLQNENLTSPFDVNELWNQRLAGEVVTGVTVVRKDYLETHKEEVDLFLTEHAQSVKAITDDNEKGAKLSVEQGIVSKEEVALKAISQCNLVCVTKTEMKNALEGYYLVLYNKNPAAVGGAMPGDDFYYE